MIYKQAAESNNLLYRTLWRWHFYAGVFCIPFVLTLALSGTIYLFKPQIDALIEQPLNSLEVSEVRTTPNAQIQAALAAVPETRFLKYTLPETEHHAVLISLNSADGERIQVYVQPYTLEVLKVINYDEQFTQLVRTFHGELLAGNTGSFIIELAGNWAIVLLLTGLYLWWPRKQQGWGGILYPRLSLKGRLFWRDLHGAIGFWVALFALFLLLTGLPWTLVWNTGFNKVRDAVEGQRAPQEWTVSRADEHLHHMTIEGSTAAIDLSPELVANAKALHLAAPAELSIASDRPGYWLLASDNQNRLLRTQAWFSQDKAQLVQLKPYSDRNALDLAIGVGISAHEGQLFGWFNQLLSLFTACALILLCVSGFIMWRKRKPQGALGAPQKLKDSGAGRGVALITLICALLLPVLGLSLLLLLLLETAVLRRLQTTRIWLGLAVENQ